MNKKMMNIKSRSGLLLSLCLLSVFSIYAPSMTFFVTSNADSGPGTLRQAILNSNANNPAPDPFNIISFAGFNGIITPLTDEPIITEPVLIDGYSAVGASPNTNNFNQPNNAVITVQINGPGAVFNPLAPLNGLVLGTGSDGSIIRGLSITNFAAVQGFTGAGNPISGNGIRVISSNNLISGNFIGMNLLGQSAPNFVGILISSGSNNKIGDGTPNGRNLVSGQYGNLGSIYNLGTNTSIQGNTVGLNQAGTAALMPGARLGIVNFDESGAIIGGTLFNQGNVIAGFSAANVVLSTAYNSSVMGNFIGTDVAGDAAVGPNGVGIVISNNTNGDQPQGIVIAGNLISGNSYGITVGDDNLGYQPVVGVAIQNNIIGLDATASFVIPNQLDGIWVKYAWATQIYRNFIAGNGRHGIRLDKSKLSNIKSNFIGTNNLSMPTLGNSADGIFLGGQGVGIQSFGDIIGGGWTSPNADGNIIISNVNGIESQGNVLYASIQGNSIITNSGYGVLLNEGANHINIGGFQNSGSLRLVGTLTSQNDFIVPPLGTSNNIISNRLDGIRIAGDGLNNTNNNEIQSNRIVSNGGNGVTIIDSSGNIVGAPDFGNSTVPQPLGNTITNNNGDGVEVMQNVCNAVDNSILSNSIVNNAADGIALVQ